MHTIEKNTKALVVTSKYTGLEINADRIKYRVLYRVQNAGRSHNIKAVNKYFEMAKQFRYLGTNLTNQNCVRLKIKHQRV
jgi:hypothetical protein